MNKFDVAEICSIVGVLQHLEAALHGFRKALPSGVTDLSLDGAVREALGPKMSDAMKTSKAITLIDCHSYIERASEGCSKNECTLGMASVELRHAHQGIVREIGRWRFIPVAPDMIEYCDQERLFGDAVYERFPEAQQDVKDAGDCIAVNLPTAAVFHLMRVAEHGLRALAKRLRVRLTDRGAVQRIEYAEWDKIITACKSKIADTKNKNSKGPKRQQLLQLYSDAADHCLFMKDIWRNDVSHTRKPYILEDAIGVYGRVRDFMMFLAKGLPISR